MRVTRSDDNVNQYGFPSGVLRCTLCWSCCSTVPESDVHEEGPGDDSGQEGRAL